MEKPLLDPEIALFTLTDVKRLYISMRAQLLIWAAFGCAVAFVGFGIITPKYRIEATFKEGLEQSSGGTEGMLKELLTGGGSGQPQAATLMKSFQVLRPLIEKTGLQIGQYKPGWIVAKAIHRYRDNLKAERELPLSDMDLFRFENVLYEGESSLPFVIRFNNPHQFAVYSPDQKTLLGEGTVGSNFRFDNGKVEFTLVETPKELKVGFFYAFTASPWIEAARSLRGGLQIISDPHNKSIYNVILTMRDRDAGARIVNELMSQYQLYLKREYDDLARHQLSYLENKQNQICEKLDEILLENVQYQRRNLSESGFGGSEEEGKGLLGFYQGMHAKILEIDTALARADLMENKERSFSALAEDGAFAEGVGQISQALRLLRQQKDLLETSLSFAQEKGSLLEESLQARREELRGIRRQRLAVQAALQDLASGKEIASLDLFEGSSAWAVGAEEERKDLADYLQSYTHLLSVREKMLQERSLYEKNRSTELEGIDLETARSLFVQYNSRLAECENLMHQYARYKKELADPHFELASLCAALKDPYSEKLIARASELELQIKDEAHRSAKESSRWQDERALHKTALAGHLDQLYKVEALKGSLLKDKMLDLQKISLDCINRQMSVLNEQAEEAVKDYRRNLLEEKKLLEQRMGAIRLATGNLPDKWRLEKWIEIKTDMVSKIMRTVTEVVESKSIASHLHRVASKPLDRATVPICAQKPYLFAKTLGGGILFALVIFLIGFVRAFTKGFPLCLEKMKALRLPVVGALSSYCDGPIAEISSSDLDVLRKLISFTQESKIVGLLLGTGSDYSFALGENLARMSVNSLVLRCDFLCKQEEGTGLLQVWQGHFTEPPVHKGKGFDYILTGGVTPFGAELIRSPKFRQLLDKLAPQYDKVFLLFRDPLSSAESLIALGLCEKAVVTVCNEQAEALVPFLKWDSQKDLSRLAFLAKA